MTAWAKLRGWNVRIWNYGPNRFRAKIRPQKRPYNFLGALLLYHLPDELTF